MRRRTLLILATLCAVACEAERESRPSKRTDSATVTAAPVPRFNEAIIDSARREITDYLHANVVDALGSRPPMDICYRNPTVRIVRQPTAVARARVLDVSPIGPPRDSRPDSLSVTAELLIVARGSEDDTTWNIAPRAAVDTVHLTMSPARSGGSARWSLCWDRHSAEDFAGEPAFLQVADSIGPEPRWTAPLQSWRSLAELTDSIRWSSLTRLAGDSAVARVEHSGGFADRLGVVQLARDGQHCLTIADSTLPPATPLLVVPPGAPQTTGRALIESQRLGPCRAPGDEWGSVSFDGARSYDVVVAPGSSLSGDAIAVVGRPDALRRVNGRATIDIDGDGRPESFAQCTSQEGLHLIVSTDSGGLAVKRWGGYIHVPYDIEPDC